MNDMYSHLCQLKWVKQKVNMYFEKTQHFEIKTWKTHSIKSYTTSTCELKNAQQQNFDGEWSYSKKTFLTRILTIFYFTWTSTFENTKLPFLIKLDSSQRPLFQTRVHSVSLFFILSFMMLKSSRSYITQENFRQSIFRKICVQSDQFEG